MTTKAILEALARLRVESGSLACLGCGLEHNCSTHGCYVLREAAAQLDHFTSENRALRNASASKPAKRSRDAIATYLREMVKELNAQREKAEAERDALLEYAKTMQECEMCKNDSFCHLRDPMKDDCKHCQRASDCPCQKCEENNCWEWRGLPEAPEEGGKA